VAAKEEAENANRSKTRFLAAASHDLLQPLNAARLSASALADLALGPEALAISGQIERGLQIIEDLIKTLLDISKLDAGVVRPAIKPVALSELLTGIAASFRPFAERKGLRLSVRGPDLVVASDPLLLQRIVQNLVSNAIRYTRQGGVLVAVRRRGQASGEACRIGETCRIQVFDTGCGIAQAEQDLVFEEFFRGGAEGEGGEPGLGLGLSIVRRMALALDHPLELASRAGRGTRMALTLPVSRTAPERAVTMSPVTTRLTGARVLVVENDPPTADALERLLRAWDAEVCVHRDLAGVEAALASGMTPPDLLVLDYHLDNGACGLGVATHLEARTGLRRPVIVTTANHSPEIEAEVAALGAQLVHKPVRPAQLRALLTYLLA
jgi:CheY-like chemotaxis protein